MGDQGNFYKDKVKEQEKEVKRLKSKTQELQATKAHLTKELDELDQKFIKLHSDNVELANTVRRLFKERNEIMSERDSARAELEELQAKLQTDADEGRYQMSLIVEG